MSLFPQGKVAAGERQRAENLRVHHRDAVTPSVTSHGLPALKHAGARRRGKGFSNMVGVCQRMSNFRIDLSMAVNDPKTVILWTIRAQQPCCAST